MFYRQISAACTTRNLSSLLSRPRKTLVLRDNRLVELRGLAALRHLTAVDVSGNKLTQVGGCAGAGVGVGALRAGLVIACNLLNLTHARLWAICCSTDSMGSTAATAPTQLLHVPTLSPPRPAPPCPPPHF